MSEQINWDHGTIMMNKREIKNNKHLHLVTFDEQSGAAIDMPQVPRWWFLIIPKAIKCKGNLKSKQRKINKHNLAAKKYEGANEIRGSKFTKSIPLESKKCVAANKSEVYLWNQRKCVAANKSEIHFWTNKPEVYLWKLALFIYKSQHVHWLGSNQI